MSTSIHMLECSLAHTVIKQKDKLSTSYDDCKQYEKEDSYWQVEWLDLHVFITVSSQLYPGCCSKYMLASRKVRCAQTALDCVLRAAHVTRYNSHQGLEEGVTAAKPS